MPFKEFHPEVVFNSPQQIWENAPSNLVAEVQHIILFFVITLFAFRSKDASMRILYFGALIGGILTELLTIYNTEIGNFYHSQFTIQLFGREPFYMLFGVYLWYQCVLTSIVWPMRLSTLGEFCVTVIVASYMWQPFDLIGAKYMWWQWHQSDPLYAERTMFVPNVSTFWIMAHFSSLQLAVRLFRNRIDSSKISVATQFFYGSICAVLGAVGMNICFLIFYHPIVTFAGYRADMAIFVFEAVCYFVVTIECFNAIIGGRFAFKSISQICQSKMLWCVLLLQMGVFEVILYTFDPTKQLQTSYFQPYSDTELTESCFWGAFQRNRYVSKDALNLATDPYQFDCVDGEPTLIEDGSEWITLCGTALTPEWIAHFQKIVFLGSLFAAICQSVVINKPKAKLQ